VHPGAGECIDPICCAYTEGILAENPDRRNISVQEQVAGQKYVLSLYLAYAELMFYSALKHFVLSQGWRNARYVVEPGCVSFLTSAYAILILGQYWCW
jgi:hypothetical protein